MTVPAAVPEAEPHIRALTAHLGTVLAGAALVDVGEASDGDLPYIVLYPDPGEVTSTRLVDARSRITLHVIVHAIGTGPEQASWVMDRVRAAMFAGFTVDGRVVHRPVQTLGPQPMQRDDSGAVTLFYQVAEFEVSSDPAA